MPNQKTLHQINVRETPTRFLIYSYYVWTLILVNNDIKLIIVFFFNYTYIEFYNIFISLGLCCILLYITSKTLCIELRFLILEENSI
jgi:hypothetical protein